MKQVEIDLEVASLSIDGLVGYPVAPAGVVPVVAAQHYYLQPAGPRVTRPVVVELLVASFHPNIQSHKKSLDFKVLRFVSSEATLEMINFFESISSLQFGLVILALFSPVSINLWL